MCRHYGTVYGCGKCLKEVFLLGQQLKMHLKVCAASPKVTLPPHLISSLHHRVPKKAHTTASTRRRNWTPPRSPALTPRFTSLTRRPSVRKRVHPRRRSGTRTRWTNTSPKSPTKSRPSPSVHICSPSSWSNAARSGADNSNSNCTFI